MPQAATLTPVDRLRALSALQIVFLEAFDSFFSLSFSGATYSETQICRHKLFRILNTDFLKIVLPFVITARK